MNKIPAAVVAATSTPRPLDEPASSSCPQAGIRARFPTSAATMTVLAIPLGGIANAPTAVTGSPRTAATTHPSRLIHMLDSVHLTISCAPARRAGRAPAR